MVKVSANISMLFTELSLLERPAAARRAGFEHVESWWPWPRPDPPEDEVEAFVGALRSAGVSLTALNFYAGDMAAGDAGVLSLPDRRDEFRRSVEPLRAIAEATGCRAHNAIYGPRVPGLPAGRQDSEAAGNLAFAAEAVAATGGTVLLEPISAAVHPDYPLRVPEDVLEVIARVRAEHGATNLALLFDVFHLAGNGVEVLPALAAFYPHVGHVQLADHPGRGAPGTGTLDVPAVLRLLEERGYAGYVACEYNPSGPTEQSLTWLESLPGTDPA